jgi:hypothetical protein
VREDPRLMLDDLRARIAARRVMVFVGTGVS